jgi:hypothetical protein
VLGFILQKQSKEKFYTKHYIKNGFTAKEAFENWKKIYNFSLVFTYLTVLIAAARYYDVNGGILGITGVDDSDDIATGWGLARHIIALVRSGVLSF